EENIALPLLLTGLGRREALAQAAGWFERLGLDGLQRRRSGELSGGQAQRVALGRGLGGGPRGVFRDGATRAVGSGFGRRGEELAAAARERSTTVVLVTHEPRVAGYADREVIVRDGRVTFLSGDRVVV